jgi:hypothetical protein
MAQPIPIAPGNDAVTVQGGTLYIHELAEQDVQLVRLVEEADDAEDATRQCLRIGARAVRAASVSLDGDIVEKHFGAMTARFDEHVTQAVAELTGKVDDVLNEEHGALAGALNGHASQLEQLLGSAFDPDSKRSVLALFGQVMQDAHEAQTRAVQRLVAVDGDESPLGKLQRAINRDVKDELGGIRKEMHELSEKIAVHAAIAPVIEQTSGKGFTFEDVLHRVVERIAVVHGDLAEKVAKQRGVRGNDKGDELVTLDRADTGGVEGRFVFEAKTGKLGIRRTYDELDAALANRDATAGIAVFSEQENAPTTVRFSYTDNRAIVVLDRDGHDDSALRLGYMWARWVVRRELAGVDGDELDLARIGKLIDNARLAIERQTAIKRFLSTATKNIDHAVGQVSEMVDEVNAALDNLCGELAS